MVYYSALVAAGAATAEAITTSFVTKNRLKLLGLIDRVAGERVVS